MMTAEHLAPTREARLSKHRRPQHATTFLLLLCALSGHSGPLLADTQTDPDSASVKLAWSTDSVGPARFVSVHGRRAAVFGYSEDGLEVWAYPFQILSSYKLSFLAQGTTTAINGQSLLRRIIYSPEAVTRIYAGPDFIVRENIFVPLEEPGAIIRYEVAS